MKFKKILSTILITGSILTGCSQIPKIQKKSLSLKEITKPDTIRVYLPDTTKVNPLDTLKGKSAYLKSKGFYEEAQRIYSQGYDDSSKIFFNKATKLLSQSQISSKEWDFIDPLEILNNLEMYQKLNRDNHRNGITVTPEEIQNVINTEKGFTIGKKFAKKIAYNEKVLETKQKKWFLKTLEKFLQYEPFLDSLLKEKNLPEIFKYSYPIESAMETKIRSRAGAVGIAQWMKGSARLWNLKVETYYDERLDPLKAISPSLDYLKYLYSYYDDADLAIAAYNWGNARILRALNQTNSTNYNELLNKWMLPKETENHLPRIHAFRNLAKKTKIENPKRDSILENLLTGNFDEAFIHQQTGLKVMSKILGISLKDFKKYNPAYPMNNTPKNKINREYNYPIRIPKGRRTEFLEKLSKVKKRVEKYSTRIYKIRKGDTLGGIALKFKIRLYNLKRINGFPNPKRLRPGKKLKIPLR